MLPNTFRVSQVVEAKARWIGHKLHADVAIRIDDTLPLSAANRMATSLESELFEHMPALAAANVRFSKRDAWNTIIPVLTRIDQTER